MFCDAVKVEDGVLEGGGEGSTIKNIHFKGKKEEYMQTNAQKYQTP